MGAAIGAGADDLMGVVSGAVAVIFQGAGDLPGRRDRGRRAGGVMGAAIGAVAVIFLDVAIEDAAAI